MLLFLLLQLAFVASVTGQTCAPAGNLGPCRPGFTCPSGSTCLATGGSCVCCLNSCIFNPNCLDLVNPSTGRSECPQRASLCTNPSYSALMAIQCPRTCGRCPCVDLLNPATGRSDCPSRANLCNNAAYFSLMTRECPRTCGRCPSG